MYSRVKSVPRVTLAYTTSGCERGSLEPLPSAPCRHLCLSIYGIVSCKKLPFYPPKKELPALGRVTGIGLELMLPRRRCGLPRTVRMQLTAWEAGRQVGGGGCIRPFSNQTDGSPSRSSNSGADALYPPYLAARVCPTPLRIRACRGCPCYNLAEGCSITTPAICPQYARASCLGRYLIFFSTSSFSFPPRKKKGTPTSPVSFPPIFPQKHAPLDVESNPTGMDEGSENKGTIEKPSTVTPGRVALRHITGAAASRTRETTPHIKISHS